MKRLLGTILALTVIGIAVAQSETTFNVTVDSITAIALGAPSIDDVEISYSLVDGEFTTMTSTAVQLRYITNEVGDPETISQDQCEPAWDADLGEVVLDCGDPLTATAGQFLPSYITIAAGGWDGDDLYEVAAFSDALELSVTTPYECSSTAFANDFAVPDGFASYTRTVPLPEDGEWTKTWDAVDFSDEVKAWAESHIGTVQAPTGNAIELAFDGVSAYLVGNPDDAASMIRGAVCGELPGTGLDIIIDPVRVGDTILPAGTTPVAVQITIHDLDDL